MASVFRQLFISLVLTAPVGAATFYVSPSESDQADGSATAPFASIQTGIQHLAPGDILMIRQGTYFGPVSVTLSGTADKPITIEAQPHDCVNLVGAQPVQGSWYRDQGGIFKAPWPNQPIQVFCDGHLLNEARWPHAEVEGLSRQPVAIADAGSPTFTACSHLPPVDLTGAYLQLMAGQSWCAYTRLIQSEDRATGTLVFSSPVSEMAALFPRKGDRFYVFGKKELLGAPGEWWWDPGPKTLYIWTPDGKDPAGRVEAGQASWVLSLDGQSYVAVKGLNARGGWFSLRDSHHCVVQDCNLTAPNWNRLVDGFKVYPYALGGGDITGTDNQWLGGTIRFAGRSGIHAEGSGQTIAGVTVEDSVWNWCSDGAIYLHNCDHTLVKNCTVKRSGRMGISLMTVAHCQILNNSVEDVDLYSNDGGDLDTWGTDGQGTEIAYNRFGRNASYWGGGLYIDDNSKNYDAHDNLIEDIGWYGIIFKDVNRVEHNTVRNAGHQGVLIFPPAGKSLQGGWLAHNQVEEPAPVRVDLSSASVTDWGYYGGYAYLSPASQRVEIDWDQLDQPSWARHIPMDLTKIDLVKFSLDRPSNYEFQVSNLRFLPAGQTGDNGAVTVQSAWGVYTGSGSTGQLTLSGPVTWGISGTNVLGGWGTLQAPMPGGAMDLTAYRGMAFEIQGSAEPTENIQGLTAVDNGPEAKPGRGAKLPLSAGAGTLSGADACAEPIISAVPANH